MPIALAALAVLLMFPILLLTTTFAWLTAAGQTLDGDEMLLAIGDEVRPEYRFGRRASLFSLSVSGSCLLTVFALLLGHLALPSAPVPDTLQMVIVNRFGYILVGAIFQCFFTKCFVS